MSSNIKRGTVRGDGKVLWRLVKGKEVWVTKEQYDRREKTRKKYTKMRYEKWKKEFPKEKYIKKGFLNPETGLYFYKYSIFGKEYWVTKEEYEKRTKRTRCSKLKYYNKLKQLPLPNYCPGDKNPDNPDLYVVRIDAHKVVWGTYEEYCRHKKNRCASYKKYQNHSKLKKLARSKEIRKERLAFLKENPSLKRKRGDLDPVLKLVFWGYSSYGTEVWLNPEKFAQRREKTLLDRRKSRERKKNGAIAV